MDVSGLQREIELSEESERQRREWAENKAHGTEWATDDIGLANLGSHVWPTAFAAGAKYGARDQGLLEATLGEVSMRTLDILHQLEQLKQQKLTPAQNERLVTVEDTVNRNHRVIESTLKKLKQ